MKPKDRNQENIYLRKEKRRKIYLKREKIKGKDRVGNKKGKNKTKENLSNK